MSKPQDVKLTSFGEEGIGLAAGRSFKVFDAEGTFRVTACFIISWSHQKQLMAMERFHAHIELCERFVLTVFWNRHWVRMEIPR